MPSEHSALFGDHSANLSRSNRRAPLRDPQSNQQVLLSSVKVEGGPHESPSERARQGGGIELVSKFPWPTAPSPPYPKQKGETPGDATNDGDATQRQGTLRARGPPAIQRAT